MERRGLRLIGGAAAERAAAAAEAAASASAAVARAAEAGPGGAHAAGHGPLVVRVDSGRTGRARSVSQISQTVARPARAEVVSAPPAGAPATDARFAGLVEESMRAASAGDFARSLRACEQALDMKTSGRT